MKKVILTKTNSKQVTCGIKPTSPDNVKSKLAYAELFRAVLEIPEKDVQLRILDAVNGRSSNARIVHAMCPNCKQIFGNLSDTRVQVSTQTDINEIVSFEKNPDIRIITLPLNTTSIDLNSNINSDENGDPFSSSLQKSINSSTIASSIPVAKSNSTPAAVQSTNTRLCVPDVPDAVKPNVPVKRKRKRKLCLPQVVKRSHAQMAQTQLQPKLKSRKVEQLNNSDMYQMQGHELDDLDILVRRDSIGFITSELLEFLNVPNEHKSKEEHIKITMAREYFVAEERTEGLLAIHRTIIANDIYALRRQIFVWKKLRKIMDLNYLLTDEDEDCLQLAITQDCYPKIIDVLLNEGLNSNEIDDHSNTCIHLAILNEIEPESVRLLMQKIDLKILLHLNDDGYTPLHMAVRANSYLRAEIMLNTLDERLRNTPLFARSVRSTSTEADFSNYYEEICKTLEQNYSLLHRNAQPKLKKKFLEAGDRKSGNTALFFAIENKLEHFVFFLLAHLTDPRVLNFSGQDAKSYYSEFSKMLQLSLKVDNAIESVVNLLS